jgi:hypothetical protein
MMQLSERQRTADALARSINAMGAWVVNPMPLAPGAELRFQVLEGDRQRVLEKLSSWDWSPALISSGPRFTSSGAIPSYTYEVYIEPDRQPIVDTRIHGEIATPKKSDAEVQAVLKYLGWGPKT